MSPKNCLWLLLAAFLPLVGNQVGPTLPETVTVTQGEVAVLHYDFSALPSSQRPKKDLFISCSNYNGARGVPVCDFHKGKSHALGDFSTRAEISRLNDTNHLYRLTINQTRFSDQGDYICDVSGGSDADGRTVHLAIKGRVENRELSEGADLTIDLPLSSCSIEFYGKQQNVTVCRVENGQVVEAAEEFRQRLSMQNRTLILSNLTAKDRGNYTVWDQSRRRAILTLAVEIQTIPLGDQTTGRVENRELPEGANLTIDLPLSPCSVQFYGKQQNGTVCRVENGQVIEVAEEYHQRLSMQNRTLILSNLTAKDHGNYTVWDQSRRRAILTLAVEIKTIPLGVQTTGRVENRELYEGADLSIDLPLSSCYIEFYGKQQNVTVWQVKNGERIEAAEEYRQRLRMRNGTFIVSNLTIKDQGNFTVWDESRQRVILTLALEIKTTPPGDQTTGRVENRELYEGADLSIDLPLSSYYIEFYGKQQNVTVCRVKNGERIEAAEEYHQRLGMRNGTFILSNLTTKDQGNYTVWDESRQRVILTLALEIKTTNPWIFIYALVAVGSLLAVGLFAAGGIYKWCAGRKMKKDAAKKFEALEMSLLKKSNSTADIGSYNELKLNQPLHDSGSINAGSLEVKGCAANQIVNGKNVRDC